jgi:PII-like signaling protein
MHQSGHALQATIFIGEDDIWHHKPVGHEIVRRARDPGLAGATILRGSEGLGTSALIHTQRILSLAGDLPLVVIIVDAEDKVRDFLPELDDLMSEGMVVLDDVQVVR